jgi:hypothetical protein
LIIREFREAPVLQNHIKLTRSTNQPLVPQVDAEAVILIAVSGHEWVERLDPHLDGAAWCAVGVPPRRLRGRR